ncbi:Maf family protein [Lederbergia citrea]|uniref:dTTP/UTP pyrophosphatase n=1 Tax=Lederbergia citrea TaxID=2833581 RepID=A0A942UTD6_9BACI|nr:Maf family protein [Lederbergia citrea]MBS4176193.1 septum formation inhibitor Maf [Lederbergia citrea]MBS4222579.1 septum formation inhibitor Maf [Lederbergia citrea]
MLHLVLASASPRRKELLQKLNIPFSTFSPHADESFSPNLSPNEIVTMLALRKANMASAQFPESIVIGSDTIVVNNDKVLGKPANRQEAKQMLEQLSGQTHSVYTGVAVVYGKISKTFYEKTDVEFWELSDADIERYLDSGEPFDKAGAYGIQGLGALHVKSIKGDYYAVVGLPISRLSRTLSSMGLGSPPE